MEYKEVNYIQFVRTIEIEGGFLIDITYNNKTDLFEGFLYHADCGVKSFCFGMPRLRNGWDEMSFEDCIKEFIELFLMDVELEIESYSARFMD